ncbi:MAG: DMT family transporter [Spirochaetales bacterium]|nr:DMT family transporter [Spirochaetales bacterium]
MVLSILWGGSFFFSEVALTAFPPFTIVFLRLIFGAAILLTFMKFRGLKLPKEKKVWFSFFILGLLNNAIPFSFIVSGQELITGGLASLVNASTPFFTVIAAHFLTRDEKITRRKLAGLLIGFSGVFTLIGLEAVMTGGNSLPGMFMVMTASLSYAFGGIWGRRTKALGLEPLVMAAGQLTCAAIILLPLSLFIDAPWTLPLPGWNVWGALLGAGLLSTALAYILYFRILSSSGATSVLLVTFLIPVSAILLGVLFLGEAVGFRHFMGMGILGIGLVVIDGRLMKKAVRVFRGFRTLR